MSRYGAVQLQAHIHQPHRWHGGAEGLPPMVEGRWAAWARSEPALAINADDHSLTDHPCRLPDGRLGRVAVVQQGADWALVCRVA
jgi:hypothetical protein